FRSDGVSGRELWKSDGTAAGTVLVMDISAGTGSSSPRYFANVNGTLFFNAHDGVSGYELWKSDGTAAGTVLVKDISAGPWHSNPESLTNVNGTLYFSADDGVNGRELWKSDGTAAGTVMVMDIWAGFGGSFPRSLVNANGTLFFLAVDGVNGEELWKSDGTAAGTVLVKDIMAGSGHGSPYYLTNVNGTLFFTADDGVNGSELWKSDGTAAGTVLVKDIAAGSGSSNPLYLTNFNGTLYFSANDGVNGYELWKSDGTAAGTVLVKDIWAGAGSSYPNSLTNVNGTLYFSANDGVNGYELWKSDGTAAGTQMLGQITSGSGSGSPSQLLHVASHLFFTAQDGTHGVELWAFPLGGVPVVGLAAGPVAFTEGDPATLIDTSATVIDLDSADFDTGTLTVEFTANGAAEDSLVITTTANVRRTGNDIEYDMPGWTVVGTVPASGAGSGIGGLSLTITFDADCTPAIAQDVLRAIAYSNSSDAPSTLTRTVRVTVNDGDGNDSNQPTLDITVTAVNDAPVLAAGPHTFTSRDEDDIANAGDAIDVSTIISDPDGPGTGLAVVGANNSNGDWQYTIDNGTNWLSFGAVASNNAVLLASDAANTRIRFIPSADWNGNASIQVKAWDQFLGGNGATNVDTAVGTAFGSNTETFTIAINAVNDAPSVTGGSNPTVLEDAGPQTILNFVGINPGPANESGQAAMAYTVENLTPAGGLVFTTTPSISTSGTLTFEAAPNSNGSATFQVRVQDDGGGTAPNVDTSGLSATFTITVNPVNDAPSFTPGVNLDPLAPTAGPQNYAAWATAISKGPANESTQNLSFVLTPVQTVGTLTFITAPDIDETSGNLTFEINNTSDGFIAYNAALTDDGGTANGGVDTSTPPALLIIAVWQQNVYVDLAFSALNYGDDPPGPALRYGIDAFDTVQKGVNFVGVTGGVVHVAGGTYAAANVIVPRDMTLDLTAGGVVLQGNGGPALQVNNGTVVVQGGTLDQQTVQPAVLHVGGSLTLEAGATVDQNANGPAIEVASNLTLDGATVLESSTSSSLCILLQAAGTLNLDGSTNANTLTIRTGGNFIDVAAGGPDVTATGNNWFEDATPLDETTRAGGFAIEDHILHAIDDATRGFVRIEATHVFVTQSSGSIQRGVDEANDDDTLEVNVGTFIELVDVHRPLTLRGAQFGNVGAGRLPLVPASETIVVATGAFPAGDDLFTVSDDDVSIDGFAFQGDRPLFGTGRDARSGVNNDTNDVSGLLVTNCVFENFSECGVAVANSSGATSGTLSNSLFANCDLSAVRCEYDAFLDITGNRILTFPAGIGIQVANFSDDRGAPTNISNNNIDVNANSVAIEIVALDLTSISPIVVSNNTIAATGSGGVGIT
ncbi:MAG: hypothetical protein KDB14_35140, partial [Planctomycetales bacterium]|nr:hypothetical protein [Planctomycetales bacterium]